MAGPDDIVLLRVGCGKAEKVPIALLSESAERPESLAAEALFALLVDHDDTLAGIGDFASRDQARGTSADHNYLRIVNHCIPRSLND